MRTNTRSSWMLALGAIVIVVVMLSLYWLDVRSTLDAESQRTAAATARADSLQKSLDSLRNRAEKDVAFFELVRRLITAQDQTEREALLKQLNQFKFAENQTTPSDATSTTTSRPSAPKPSPTTRSPPTTTAPPSPKPPPTTTTIVRQPPVTVCVTIPVALPVTPPRPCV